MKQERLIETPMGTGTLPYINAKLDAIYEYLKAGRPSFMPNCLGDFCESVIAEDFHSSECDVQQTARCISLKNKEAAYKKMQEAFEGVPKQNDRQAGETAD